MEKKYLKLVNQSTNDYCLNMDQASLNYLIYNNLNDVEILDPNLIGY